MQVMEKAKAIKPRIIALAVFVGLLWIIQVINWATGYSLNAKLGLIPRNLAGLDGILGMPFLHANFAHLLSNTPPLVMLGAILCATANRALIAVNGTIIVLGGALVWLLGSSGIHIGASGLVFGWFGFLVIRSIVDRSLLTFVTGTVVGLVYASLLWGVLPGQQGVSWESHLAGAFAGAVCAFVIRTKDQPLRTNPKR